MVPAVRTRSSTSHCRRACSPVLPALAASGLGTSDAVAIEKPFGTDLASAMHLNDMLRVQLPEPTIFRVDHFLSDELVGVIVLRFLNRVFEPTWNSVHIERVDVSWLESLTLEGRASYDGAGALKDMVQNHLMEVMALVLMEQPARIRPDSFGARASRRCGPWPRPPQNMCAQTRSVRDTPRGRSGSGRGPRTSSLGSTPAATRRRMPR